MNLHNLFLLFICLFGVYVGSRGAVASKDTTADVLSDMIIADMHSMVPKLKEPVSDAVPPRLSEKFDRIGDLIVTRLKKPKLMDAINTYRAKICADMKDQHGLKFSSSEACDEFMRKACHPGRDGKMDGDGDEVSTGQGYCRHFFNTGKEEEELTRTQTEPQQKTAASGSDDKDSHAGAGKEEKRASDIDKDGHPEAGKAESRASDADKEAVGDHRNRDATPSPASAGRRPTVGDKVVILDTDNTQEVFAEGISKEFVIVKDQHNTQPYQVEGSKAWFHESDVLLAGTKALSDDEKWYFKKGGIDSGRFHMDEKLKLPAQGYWGKLVEHDDGKTETGDWQQEFLLATGNNWRSICEKHPESSWCQERFGSSDRERKRSGATASTLGDLVFVVVLALNFICARDCN